jgi:hypothetical protein
MFRPIEPYVVAPVVAAASVLLCMAWSKLTVRRNRPFEPTLWFVFRWGFILLMAVAYFASVLGRVIRLSRIYPLLSGVCITVAVLAFLYIAALDWRRSARKERSMMTPMERYK